MDNEVYEAQLALDTSAFETAIKEATAVWEKLSHALNTAEQKAWFEETERQAREAGNELDALRIKVEALKALANNTGAFSTGGGIEKNSFFAVVDAVDEMLGRLQDAEKAVADYNAHLEKMGDIGDEEFSRIISAIEETRSETERTNGGALKLPDTFKKMGFAIMGVRSAFAFFRKVVSSALANNIELANKFQAIWTALGNAIAPILNRIANLIITAFSYLSVFVKAVSGGKIDLLAKTSKSAKSTAGSLKEANKYLAGFDELQNVDDSKGGGSGGGSGGIGNPFKDVDLNPEWVERIQKFGEFVRAHFPEIIALVGGFFLAWKTGADLLESLGVGLVLFGIYEAFKGLWDILEGSFIGDLALVARGFKEVALGATAISLGLMLITKSFTGWQGLVVAGIALIVSWAIEHWDELNEGWDTLCKGMSELWHMITDAIIQTATSVRDWVVRKWDEIKEGWNNTKQAIVEKALEIKQKVVDKWNEIKANFATAIDGIKTKWSDLKTNMVNKVEEIKTGIKGKINGIIGFFEGLANAGIRAINKVVQAFNKISFNIPSWVPVIGGKSFGFNLKQVGEISLARLDSGTNYVPNDQLAMIHKGEAVIPKKFNSEDYFNNADTAEKLDRVIDLIESIDFQPYITVKDIGTTATKYQAQQVRIMGGKL